MWTSTTGFSINVLMLDHKLRQRLHYSFDSDFHVRPGYIIAFWKELISWKQKSELGDKIAIFVRTTNGGIHYISNMKLLEIKKKIENIFGFSYSKKCTWSIFCWNIHIKQTASLNVLPKNWIGGLHSAVVCYCFIRTQQPRYNLWV